MRHISTLLLAALLATVAVAQDAAPPPADARLDTQLTLDLTHVTVGDLCWVIEQRTGAKVTPADTATGDLCVSVIGELSARELLDALAVTLELERGRRARSSPPEYSLRRTPASAAAQDRVPRALVQAARADLARMAEAASLPDEQIAQLPEAVRRRLQDREGNPNAALHQFRMLAGLPNETLAGLISGARVEHQPVSAYPRATRQAAMELARFYEVQSAAARARAPARAAPPPIPDSFPPEVRQQLEEARARAAANPQEQPSFTNPNHLHIGFAGGELNADTLRLGINISLLASLTGRGGSGRSTGIGLQLDGGVETPPRLPKPRPENSDLPRPVPAESLRDEVLDGRYNAPLDAEMRRLSKGLGRACVWDDNDGLTRQRSSPSVRHFKYEDGTPMEAFLDTAATSWKRQWAETEGAICWRRNSWQVQRFVELPASKTRRWRALIIEAGELPLDEAAELMTLPTAVRSNALNSLGIITPLSGLTPRRGVFAAEEQFWPLWRRLPPAAKERMQADGLRVAELPQAVQPLALELFATVNSGSRVPVPVAQTIMRIERVRNGGDMPDPNRPPPFPVELTMLELAPPEGPSRRIPLRLMIGRELPDRLRNEEMARQQKLRAAADVPEETPVP